MKNLSTIILLFIFGNSYGQDKECFCEKDTLMNSSTVDCETTILNNNSKLYWQFNCNRIWLTLENEKGDKIVIDEGDKNLYSYIYRLNYHLIKEYENSLLFRTDCSASGPCSYILIDKKNGKKLDEFGQLICIDTDSQWEGESHKYEFDFIVYLSNETDDIIVDFIDSKKKIKFPFKEVFSSIIPQKQFDKMTLLNNILTIYYESDEKIKKTININLNKNK